MFRKRQIVRQVWITFILFYFFALSGDKEKIRRVMVMDY